MLLLKKETKGKTGAGGIKLTKPLQPNVSNVVCCHVSSQPWWTEPVPHQLLVNTTLPNVILHIDEGIVFNKKLFINLTEW